VRVWRTEGEGFSGQRASLTPPPGTRFAARQAQTLRLAQAGGGDPRRKRASDASPQVQTSAISAKDSWPGYRRQFDTALTAQIESPF
jgi:hypothetical protein